MSFRTWCKSRGGIVTMVTIPLGSVLAVFVSWQTLGWPTPALSSDLVQMRSEMTEVQAAQEMRIAGVEQLNLDTRALLLNDRWERVFRELQHLLSKTNQSAADRERIIQLQIKKRLTERQLQQIESGQ